MWSIELERYPYLDTQSRLTVTCDHSFLHWEHTRSPSSLSRLPPGYSISLVECFVSGVWQQCSLMMFSSSKVIGKDIQRQIQQWQSVRGTLKTYEFLVIKSIQTYCTLDLLPHINFRFLQNCLLCEDDPLRPNDGRIKRTILFIAQINSPHELRHSVDQVLQDPSRLRVSANTGLNVWVPKNF